MSKVRVLLLRREHCSTLDLRPGEYLTGINHKPWATIRCPKCKLLCTITRGSFGVTWDGDVSPQAICPQAGCSFREWLAFAGWVPESQGTA